MEAHVNTQKVNRQNKACKYYTRNTVASLTSETKSEREGITFWSADAFVKASAGPPTTKVVNFWHWQRSDRG
ncbi:hypothetical protein CCACVL1_03136 [Corchorus capsularis]|uniref:Uncharacterized protein n=1 Tax=Corchorus capsularis TaxID=210143 RepID=A0A1R3K2B0_COCAP|nr:hypothetical protein CCACVL1_03136 [Corchorus capsularis]